jgi:hypothetical protein
MLEMWLTSSQEMSLATVWSKWCGREPQHTDEYPDCFYQPSQAHAKPFLNFYACNHYQSFKLQSTNLVKSISRHNSNS